MVSAIEPSSKPIGVPCCSSSTRTVAAATSKLIKSHKRFLAVDTLERVLRVLVTAASVGEREGGKRVLQRVKHMGKRPPRFSDRVMGENQLISELISKELALRVNSC